MKAKVERDWPPLPSLFMQHNSRARLRAGDEATILRDNCQLVVNPKGQSLPYQPLVTSTRERKGILGRGRRLHWNIGCSLLSPLVNPHEGRMMSNRDYTVRLCLFASRQLLSRSSMDYNAQSQVELRLCARKLPNLDLMSKSDAFAVVYLNSGGGRYVKDEEWQVWVLTQERHQRKQQISIPPASPTAPPSYLHAAASGTHLP